ncbi:monocarboxylate transporter 12-like [Bacillus rossius redtenbacheri]|uniref:monocarboxylate transporter 12-like n=1 Tax=Bacillus rossius redtenbacheri TaxID=93214 RepID=UPI002FDDB822
MEAAAVSPAAPDDGGGILKASSSESKESLHVQFHSSPRLESQEGLAVDPGSSSRSDVDVEDVDEDVSSESCDEDEEDEEDESLQEPQPPDGGYGWVVVIAAFCTNMIADGITFSFGVIYVELLDYFRDGSGKTAWIGGLFMAMPLLCGPLASYLVDRYGCRKACMSGGLVSALGFVASSLAGSVDALVLTFGVVSGAGMALCYVTAVVAVAYYFDRRRSLAMGLAVCGSGIGTVVFAPLADYLLAEFGWRGTTLILAGVFLNMTVCGALMRDLEWTQARSKRQRRDRKARNRERRSRHQSQSLRTQTSSQTSSALVLDPAHVEEIKKLLERGELSEAVLPRPQDPAEKQAAAIGDQPRLCSSLVSLPTFLRGAGAGGEVPPEALEQLLRDNQQLCQALLRARGGDAVLGRPHQEPREEACRVWVAGCGRSSSERSLGACHLRGIRMHRNSISYRGAMLNIHKYRIRASSCPDIYRNSMITITKADDEPCAWLWDALDVLRDMVDVSLFADPQFLLFSVSNFLLYSWYHVPYVFLTDRAISLGVGSVDAAYLISYLGVLNMAGEVILGWAGDQAWLDAGLVYAACMTACGLSALVVPFVSSYAGMAGLAGVFGFSIAANYSLSSIILVELVSIERFTNAYGMLLLVQGVANLLGPPVAGWLRDVYGDYDMSFYLAGLFIVLCGLLLFVLPARRCLLGRREAATRGRSLGNILSAGDAGPKDAGLRPAFK